MLRSSTMLTNMGLLHSYMASQVCTGLAKGGGGAAGKEFHWTTVGCRVSVNECLLDMPPVV